MYPAVGGLVQAVALVLTILRQGIDLKGFKRDINEGRQAFERKVVDGGWIESARKFR